MKCTPYFPVYLNLRGAPCLVAGGGAVAARKAEGLLEAGAEVTVVSPVLTKEFLDRVSPESITWIRSEYAREILGGHRLVIAATDNRDVNNQVYTDAEGARIPVNVVDDPEHCRFIVPATYRRGHIQVAVTTGGGAPGIASRIRDSIGDVITGTHVTLVAHLKGRRDRIKAIPKVPRRLFWRAISEVDLARFDNNEGDIPKYVDGLIEQFESEATP